MALCIVVVAIVNLALGFALAVYLARRYRAGLQNRISPMPPESREFSGGNGGSLV